MGKYDHIIDLPHKQSAKRPHMPAADRAAQFAPFAVLTGYSEELAETARAVEESCNSHCEKGEISTEKTPEFDL